MGKAGIIQKVIFDKLIIHDPIIDTIYVKSPNDSEFYNRTQVDIANDLCFEVTNGCNQFCSNCFSDFKNNDNLKFLDVEIISKQIENSRSRLVRSLITGGEPFLHPKITKILDLPNHFNDLNFVISTNGTLISKHCQILINNNWIIAISLNGNNITHNKYTLSENFKKVSESIIKLAENNIIHIYCVLHKDLCYNDIDWLFNFRDYYKIDFLRFIKVRPYGRYVDFNSTDLISYIQSKKDEKSGTKIDSSNTHFISVDGELRKTN